MKMITAGTHSVNLMLPPTCESFKHRRWYVHHVTCRGWATVISFDKIVSTELKLGNKKMTTLVTGATGLVGKRLLAKLSSPVICSRNVDRARQQVGDLVSHIVQWDPLTSDLVLDDSVSYRTVINLMGEPIAEGRWNKEKKRRIRDSRVLGTRRLVDRLLKRDELPSVLVSASAVGIYGDRGEAIVEEDGPHGSGFLAEVCEAWEAESQRLEKHGVRVVNPRIGIVLGLEGGALANLIPLFKAGLGAKLGKGNQWVPWIHIDDLVDLLLWLLEADAVSGPVNAASPNPVRNQELTKELAKCLKRRTLVPAPRFAVRAALGEFADSLFDSQRVVPAVALASGFQFRFPDLSDALKDLIK